MIIKYPPFSIAQLEDKKLNGAVFIMSAIKFNKSSNMAINNIIDFRQQQTTDVKQRRSSYLHRLLSISLFIILYCPTEHRERME